MPDNEESVQQLAENGEAGGQKDFITVGIGASAGGIKALKQFFSEMPPDSGMAFAVVLHLSPKHESNLAEIIQKETAMPVKQVMGRERVVPNSVYVIPPNKNLAMVDGSITVTDIKDKRGGRVAIDLFFRTLASAYGKNSVCVVLSGTGSDGTIGLKQIKENNGFAIVQDPSDAEYDSMPLSAIGTNLVDWVLPVEKIPERLLKFKASSERMRLTDGDEEKGVPQLRGIESLPDLLTLLRIRTGHDFSTYKHATLLRRIARHLQIFEIDDIRDYIQLLRERPDDLQSLLKNLLINVTNFFRDKEAFRQLEKHVIPKLFAGKKGNESVRVWSVGCASGEEAYSLGILLSEFASKLHDPPKLQIFATDVDDEAIVEARDHVYPVGIEADVSPDRLQRFFTKEGEHYRVRKDLREIILFAPHNVLRDPPFSRLDMVVCRNLLIYLNRDAQDKVLQIFHFAIRPEGFLFLGNSESAEGQSTLFTPVDKKNRIYMRRTGAISAKEAPVLPVIGEWQIKIPELNRSHPPERLASAGEIHYKLVEQFAPPSVLVNEDMDIVHLSESAGRYFRFTGGEPTSNLFKAVHPDLLPDLRAGVYASQREKKNSEFDNIKVSLDGDERLVKLTVRNVDDIDIVNAGREFMLIIFEETALEPANDSAVPAPIQLDKDEALETVTRRLEEELRRAKDQLRYTIEQHETSMEELKAANEEHQAVNEELRSASEELETGKEELQSVNEELTTVNQELKEKVDELSRTNSDLQNLMSSTDIGTIFLDRSLRIKRFTPSVQKLFNVIATDVGRPLEHLTHKLDYESLTSDAVAVLRNLTALEDEVKDQDGNTYLLRILPYRTVEDKIEGVVLTFVDISDREVAEENLREANERFRVIVNQASTGVIQTDLDGNFVFVNQQFCDMTGFTAAELARMNVKDITLSADIPDMLKAFDRLRHAGTPFELEKRLMKKDGKLTWVHTNVTAIRDRSGRPQSAIAIILDINERKLREEEEKGPSQA
jgi:two-component system CheB/CheR fusion protein